MGHIQTLQAASPICVCVHACVCVSKKVCVHIDCTRKWMATPYKIFRHPPCDKIALAARACILSSYGYSIVLSPEVDESTIQPPTLLLVVGEVSLPLKCEYSASWSLLDRVLVNFKLPKFAEMLLENDVVFITP